MLMLCSGEYSQKKGPECCWLPQGKQIKNKTKTITEIDEFEVHIKKVIYLVHFYPNSSTTCVHSFCFQIHHICG